MDLRVLTWNLKHGRAVPPAGRDLFADFAGRLVGWDWDVALLQEVPPWWPPRLEPTYRLVMTSRNSLLPVRRWVAERRPDLIKSNGGGCNAILVRGMPITEHRAYRLAALPERRWLHAVRLQRLWVANVHLAASPAQARLAARTALGWARDTPLILGGDFNLPVVHLGGFTWAGGSGVDHVLVRGVRVGSQIRVLDRGPLSDHAPVLVDVRR